MIEVDTSEFVAAKGKEPRGPGFYRFVVGNKRYSTDGNYSECLARAKTWFKRRLRKRDFTIILDG